MSFPIGVPLKLSFYLQPFSRFRLQTQTQAASDFYIIILYYTLYIILLLFIYLFIVIYKFVSTTVSVVILCHAMYCIGQTKSVVLLGLRILKIN